jgi:predicted DNA-binding protein (UPF0251 family)
MPRRRRLRKVVAPPRFKGYRPYGNREGKQEPVEIFYEEYEAIKLADYDGLNHQEASEIMGISRPTFARIYEAARRKIAAAFVEAREIITVFGHAWLDKSWFFCDSCHSRFTIPNVSDNLKCPLCSSVSINQINN